MIMDSDEMIIDSDEMIMDSDEMVVDSGEMVMDSNKLAMDFKKLAMDSNKNPVNYDEIARDGFSYACGKFYAHPGRVERHLGSFLRAAFLPNLTPEGERCIRESNGSDFVRGQLKHYGVTFDENELTGDGTCLLQKVLLAGKCDEVPHHLYRLFDDMREEWLQQVSEEEFAKHPEWAMEAFFVTSGQPDRKKVFCVVGTVMTFPFEVNDPSVPRKLCEAADKVSGLHHMTSYGPKTQMVFMGWVSTQVRTRAKKHNFNEAKEIGALDKEPSRLHMAYLKTLKEKKEAAVYSPVGTYIVNCEAVETKWKNWVEPYHFLDLEIRETDESGIYEGAFDFGIYDGFVILGADKTAVAHYCTQLCLRSGDNITWEDEGTESEGEHPVTTKESHDKDPSASRSRKYHFKLRYHQDLGGDLIHWRPETGTIMFQDGDMASFTGEVSLRSKGKTISFGARKISDSAGEFEEKWGSYCETVQIIRDEYIKDYGPW
ncbi:hypothetical protein GQX73_g4412 [Xylaria multiplex]|uniref:Uncharacterized protein n=1 Tax=Xylaria multiplex TaxID=323545 RepID=A0A7C8MMX0_9PEZI|nr:hypothetical protein GQX73_g4412 [Xylaria multiplex]